MGQNEIKSTEMKQNQDVELNLFDSETKTNFFLHAAFFNLFFFITEIIYPQLT